MYGLPGDFDFSMFMDRSIELVSFSANTIHFAFDGGLSLTVEASLEHRFSADGPGTDRGSVPVSNSKLMRLIGKRVVEAKPEEAGTLALRFDGGQELRCFDDSPRFESYQVRCGSKVTIV